MKAQFIGDHYHIFEDDSQSLLNDANHMHLLDYLSFNLTKIDKPLSSFLDAHFDFSKLQFKPDRPQPQFTDELMEIENDISIIYEPSAYEIPDDRIERMLSVLADSHPYYSLGRNARNAAESIIVDGFNAKASISEYLMDKKEYWDLVQELLKMAPFFVSNSYEDTFFWRNIVNVDLYYKSYLETNDALEKVRYAFSKGRQFDPPLLKIQEQQRKLKRFVSDVLCTSDEGKAIKKEKSDYSFNVDLTISINDGGIEESYSIGTLNQLLECEVMRMAMAQVKVKACKCCGRLFACEDNRKNYCDRIVQDGKTCSEVGPNKAFWDGKKTDKLYKAYRDARAKNAMRLNRKTITDEQFRYWQDVATMKRKSGADDIDDWLALTIDEIRLKCSKT